MYIVSVTLVHVFVIKCSFFQIGNNKKTIKQSRVVYGRKNQDGCFKGNINDDINVLKNLQNVYFFIQQLSNKRDYKNGYFEL